MLLWRTAEDTVVARLWSSSDGKGRTKYPMIVCAQLRGVPLRAALDRVLPELEAVQRACEATTSADEVRSILAGARERLRAALAAAPAGEPELVVPADAIRGLATEGEFAGSGEGLLRVLYQVEREMAGYLSLGPGGKSRIGTASGGSKTRIGDLRPQQIRVPACGSNPGDVALRWVRFLLAMLDPASTTVVIVPVGESWVDLIVGEPVGSQFFCIRATPKSIPLTSDIPYTLDPAFIASANKLLEAPLAGGDLVVRRSSGQGGAPLGGVAAKLGWSRQAKMLGLGIGAAVLLGILALVLRPSSPSPDEAARPAARRIDRPAQAAVPADPAPGSHTSADGHDGFDDRAWRELCGEYQDWAGQLLRRLDGPRRERFAADPGLAPVLACFGEASEPADPWSIARIERGPISHLVRDPPAPVKTAEGIRRTAEALERVREARRTLSPDGWRRLADLQLAGHAFRERGWGEAHEAVAAAIRGVSPEPGADIAGAIDAVLAIGVEVEAVQKRWGAIEEIAGTLGATGDPVLAAYRGWSARQAANGGGGGTGATTDDPVALLRGIERRLGEAEALGAELASFVQGDGWASVDQEAFRLGSRSHQSLAAGRAPDAGLFRDWLFEAPSYPAPDLAADPRRSWQQIEGGRGPKELAAASAAAAELRGCLAKHSAPAQDQDTEAFELLGRLRAQAAELAARRWSAAERGEIEAQAGRLAKRSAELAHAIDRRTAQLRNQFEQSFADTVARLRAREEITSSAALNEAWRTQRDALIASITASSGGEGGGDVVRLMEESSALEGAIDALASAAPLPELPEGTGSAPWAGEIEAEMTRQRERALAEAAGGLAPGESTEAAVGTLAASYGAARERLVSLAADASALEAMLNAGYGLAERALVEGGGGDGQGDSAGELVGRIETSLSQAPQGLRDAMAPLLDRAGRLETIGASGDRAGLAEVVRTARADAPEQALAAWRRLGGLGWPADLGELEQERVLREAVARVVGALRDAGRRERLAGELASEAIVRFERAASGLEDRAQMDVALAMLEGFGLTAGDLRSPALRLNGMLRALQQDLARIGMDEAGARALVEGFVEKAKREAGSVLAADADAMAAVERLEGALASEDEAAPRPMVDFGALGPGAMGPPWRVEVIADGAEVIYRREVEAVGGPARRSGNGAEGDVLELRFVRVTTDDGAAAYLLANELSLGQFLAIIRTGGDWEDLSTLLYTFIASTDTRRGPRVWEWEENARGLVLVIRPAAAWLREVRTMETTPSYPEGLDPGVPTTDHPLQQIPPDAAVYVAALVGCRLPTSQEWHAAYMADGLAVPQEQRNLRDASWKRQQAYVEEVRRSGKLPPWPDDGAFWPAGSRSELRGLAATSHPWDDGTLWFEPAMAPDSSPAGGPAMSHLVGNVAEYVFDDPSVFGGLADAEPAVIRELLEANASRLGVIGGSALSAPEVPVDTVQGVEIDEAIEIGFADVGVRFAFAVEGDAGLPAGVLGTARVLLRSPPYVLLKR